MRAAQIFISALVAAGSVIAAATPNSESNMSRRAEESFDPMADLTDAQQKAAEALMEDYPECAEKCPANTEGELSDVMPLCAQTDQDAEELPIEDYKNAYSCICTDKIYLNYVFGCFVKQCANNKDAMAKIFAMQYLTCTIYAKVSYPKPAAFLKEICLDNKDAPTELKVLEDTFKYSYAKSIPPVTATTYLTKWAATQTSIPKTEVAAALKDTRTPLTCQATGTSAPSGSSTKTAGAPTVTNANGTTNGNGTEGAGSAANGLVVGGSVYMMAIGAGLVGVLALAL